MTLTEADLDAIVARITAAALADSINSDGTTVTRRRGDTWIVQFGDLGDLSDRDALWVTIKAGTELADSEAIIQATEADGLVVLAGAAAATPGDASIAVGDAVLGEITLTVEAAATAELDPAAWLVYDVQVHRTGGETETLTEGVWKIVGDVTRATE